jgi:hypothetical protein
VGGVLGVRLAARSAGAISKRRIAAWRCRVSDQNASDSIVLSLGKTRAWCRDLTVPAGSLEEPHE